MRHIIYFIFFATLCGCDRSQKANTELSEENPLLANESNSSANPKGEYFRLNDSASYIGLVNTFYFQNTNRIYIELYFNREIKTNEEYESIAKLGDSIIYKDEENIRTRIPLKYGKEQFDLTGILNPINIYDDKSNFVCTANFEGLEHLDQMITSPFIAVYNPGKLLSNGKYYCIGNRKEQLTNTKSQPIVDSNLTHKVMTSLRIQRCSYLLLSQSGYHIRLNNSDSTLSFINSEDTSYVILGRRNKYTILYKSSDNEHITNAIIIPITRNNMPLILTECIVPEGDSTWENLLTYDGTKYTINPRQRLE